MRSEPNVDDIKYIVFDTIKGYQTKFDPSHPNARGYLQNGSKNVVINDDGTIKPRLGSQLVGAASTSASPIISMGKYVPRTGNEIMLRSYGTVLQFYHRTTLTWTDLQTGFTSGKIFGFEMDDISSDGSAYLYYCNGVETYRRWDGDETPSSPTAYAANPKGNILHITDNARMIVAGVPTSPAAIYVSKTNDPTDFTFSTPRVATDGAIINVGKTITGIAQLADKIYWLTRKLIGWLRFTQIAGYSGGSDLIEIRPEAETDDIGSTNQQAVLKWDNKVLFVAYNNMIKDLGSLVQHATYQIEYIGDRIKPELEDTVMTSACGIVYKNKAYIACKKNSNSTYNDRLFIYDLIAQQWESPVNLNINCFLVANGNLYYGHSINPEVYQLEVENLHSDSYNDGTNSNLYPIHCVAKSWRENFELPADLKCLYDIYIEGTIKKGTTITFKIYKNEDGISGTSQGTIDSNDTDIIFSPTINNVFSLHKFSTQKLATNFNSSGNDYFRLYLTPDIGTDFYNLQWEFSSNADGADWSVAKIGFKVAKRNYTNPNLFQSL